MRMLALGSTMFLVLSLSLSSCSEGPATSTSSSVLEERLPPGNPGAVETSAATVKEVHG